MDLTRIARGGTPILLDKPRILFFDKVATWALVQAYGTGFITALYRGKRIEAPGKKTSIELELNDIDVLAFFLWAGLQAEALQHGEDLTIERVNDFLVPMKLMTIFNAVVTSLTRGIETPPEPGKADAATVGGAVAAGPGPLKASTTRKHSASPSRSSANRRSSSGRKR